MSLSSAIITVFYNVFFPIGEVFAYFPGTGARSRDPFAQQDLAYPPGWPGHCGPTGGPMSPLQYPGDLKDYPAAPR